MNTIQGTKGGTSSTLYSTTSAISVLLRCNSDVSFPILGYLNRVQISWACPPPSKYAPDYKVMFVPDEVHSFNTHCSTFIAVATILAKFDGYFV